MTVGAPFVSLSCRVDPIVRVVARAVGAIGRRIVGRVGMGQQLMFCVISARVISAYRPKDQVRARLPGLAATLASASLEPYEEDILARSPRRVRNKAK